jgi:hypothetical protein
MSRNRFLRRGISALLAISVIAPAVALAGKPVTSGQQKLQVNATLKPAKAGARNVILKLQTSYTNPNGPQQPPYNSKTITFTGQFGTHPSAVPACKESANIKANGKTSGCPANTQVGQGTVTVNASPTIAQPIAGTVAIYNGVDDVGHAGYPKGSRDLIFYVQTSIHVNATLIFYISKTPGGGTKFVAHLTKPKKPGVTPGSYTIQKVDISVSAGTDTKPYLTDPSSCTGAWRSSFKIDNWFNQPSVTAKDQDPCLK